MVTIEEYRAHVAARRPLTPGSRMLQFMHEVSARTCLLYQEMNAAVRTPDQIREYFSRLTGTEIDPSFTAHLPFTTDFGLNTRIGARVFINSGCRFQDQGGVTIGDGALIGHNVVLATLNHDPARHPPPRSDRDRPQCVDRFECDDPGRRGRRRRGDRRSGGRRHEGRAGQCDSRRGARTPHSRRAELSVAPPESPAFPTLA